MLKCWYGFIYTNNLSPYILEEDMTPDLEGLEVIYPQTDGEKIELRLDARQDHIVILRRSAATCRYSTQYVTHRRRFTIQEMMKLAREAE